MKYQLVASNISKVSADIVLDTDSIECAIRTALAYDYARIRSERHDVYEYDRRNVSCPTVSMIPAHNVLCAQRRMHWIGSKLFQNLRDGSFGINKVFSS